MNKTEQAVEQEVPAITKIIIKNRNGEVLFVFSKENNTLKDTLEEAIRSKTNLRDADIRYANLRDADLRYANLRDANLRGTNLRYADLRYADLRDANLRGTNLRYADLCYADLRDADLRDADLCYADLRDADLCYADLCYADLRNANLRNADLLEIKEDFIQKLSLQKDEVEGLKVALQNGKVDGSTYAGECACFVGTIANVKKCNYNDLMVKPNSNSPIERWFLGIKKGDTPETNIISKITVEWINEFQKNT